MKYLTKSVLSLLFFCVLICVGYKVFENNLILTTGLSDGKNSPSEIIRRYWESSAKGDFQEIANLVSHPPESFWNCYFNTPEQCREKKIIFQERITKQKSEDDRPVFEADLNDDQDFAFLIIQNQIPKGIYEGKWKAYSIKQQWIYNNEARIRILISDEDTSLERDILLTKSDGIWRIFRFIDVDDREAYAPPK